MIGAAYRNKFGFAAYVLIVILGLAGGLIYSQRGGGLFTCQAGGYTTRNYLAYCEGSRYGDYDHGAFWFDLEPAALEHAAAAEVLFLGNSRMQVALSSRATEEWFAANPHRYYLLGFMYDEPAPFAGQVLDRLQPRPKAYVINADSFFRDTLSEPGQFAAHDPQALSRYREKRGWQRVHRTLCGSMSVLCGRKNAWFRDIETGAFVVHDMDLQPEAAAQDPQVDAAEVAREAALAGPFLDRLGVPRQCVLFTLAPYRQTPQAAAQALAAALGVSYVAPQLAELNTLDGSHLDVSSADRWSAEFFRLAGPALQACLGTAGSPP